MLISNLALLDLACRQSAAADRCVTLRDNLRSILHGIWRNGHDDEEIPANTCDTMGVAPAMSPALHLMPPSAHPPTSTLRVISGEADVQHLEFPLNPAHDVNEHPETSDSGHPAAPSRGGLFRWRRHPQLRIDRSVETLPERERQARLAAVRGVFAARDGQFDVAAGFFLTAAREPVIDLGDVPGFWRLSRAGMQAAIDAYEDAGRVRDASALTAKIRMVFRPRPLRQPRHLPTRTPRRASLSGGS